MYATYAYIKLSALSITGHFLQHTSLIRPRHFFRNGVPSGNLRNSLTSTERIHNTRPCTEIWPTHICYSRAYGSGILNSAASGNSSCLAIYNSRYLKGKNNTKTKGVNIQVAANLTRVEDPRPL